MSEISFHQQIKNNFPNATFDGWASDLYILYTPEIYKFCKNNFPFPNQVTRFYGTDKRNWIEIPFIRDKQVK